MDKISNDFRIASEIRLYNMKDEPIWFNKLADIFGDSGNDKMARSTMSKNIDKLFDFGIITGDWEKIEGSWVRVFKVSGEAESLIDGIIEKYNLKI
ncbi:MAG: hypothetical protein LBU30_04545 [Candidatus Methanoplasma sp.]|jgi:hypothetical protein|nr:hypothetical protein [Candidatus Methanoplasma sp.]